MPILQWIGIVFGGLVFICILYLAFITFAPGFSVPEQPLEIAPGPARDAPPEIPATRTEVSFDVNGTPISAWLFLPENLSTPVPCIVLGNGFGGTKAMGLARYAGRFQEAGFAALAFDYRHLGKSGGEPRQLVWIPNQLEDYHAAIAYARGIKEIDPERIALWGTSLSGGHVIVTAAKDRNIACVAAQCPGLDGRASAEIHLKTVGIGHILKMVMHGQRDFFRSWFGLSPHKIPLVGKTGTIACMNSPDAWDGFRKLATRDTVNEVCARIVLRGDKYRPVKHAGKVRCPVLLQVCERDGIVPASAADATEKELGGRAEVIRYPIGHFDIYMGQNYEKAVSDQVAFFRKHLLVSD